MKLDLSLFSAFPQLETLALGATVSLKSGPVHALKHLKRLRHLDLDGCHIDGCLDLRGLGLERFELGSNELLDRVRLPACVRHVTLRQADTLNVLWRINWEELSLQSLTLEDLSDVDLEDLVPFASPCRAVSAIKVTVRCQCQAPDVPSRMRRILQWCAGQCTTLRLYAWSPFTPWLAVLDVVATSGMRLACLQLQGRDIRGLVVPSCFSERGTRVELEPRLEVVWSCSRSVRSLESWTTR